MVLFDPVEQGLDLVVIAVIAGDRDAAAPGFVDLASRGADRAGQRRCALADGAPRHVDRRPSRAELEGAALADASAGSRDDRDAARQRIAARGVDTARHDVSTTRRASLSTGVPSKKFGFSDV